MGLLSKVLNLSIKLLFGRFSWDLWQRLFRKKLRIELLQKAFLIIHASIGKFMLKSFAINRPKAIITHDYEKYLDFIID